MKGFPYIFCIFGYNKYSFYVKIVCAISGQTCL